MIYVLICIYTHVGQFFFMLYAWFYDIFIYMCIYISIYYIFRNTKIYIYILCISVQI